MSYQPRYYRDSFSTERFHSFKIVVDESDLWVGVDKGSYCSSMGDFCKKIVVDLREEIEKYIKTLPVFLISLEPIEANDNMPDFAKELILAGSKARVGPMAAVAGFFAGYLGRKIIESYKIKELVIENGGDLFAKIVKPLSVSVYAGETFFSGKTGVSIPPGTYGICTSSGTVGHSYSMGKADAVMVVCKDITLADAYATALANKVTKPGKVDEIITLAKEIDEILFCTIICADRVGVCGELKFVC